MKASDKQRIDYLNFQVQFLNKAKDNIDDVIRQLKQEKINLQRLFPREAKVVIKSQYKYTRYNGEVLTVGRAVYLGETAAIAYRVFGRSQDGGIFETIVDEYKLRFTSKSRRK